MQIRDSLNAKSPISIEIMVYLLSASVNWLPEPVILCDGLWYSLNIEEADNNQGQ